MWISPAFRLFIFFLHQAILSKRFDSIVEAGFLYPFSVPILPTPRHRPQQASTSLFSSLCPFFHSTYPVSHAPLSISHLPSHFNAKISFLPSHLSPASFLPSSPPFSPIPTDRINAARPPHPQAPAPNPYKHTSPISTGLNTLTSALNPRFPRSPGTPPHHASPPTQRPPQLTSFLSYSEPLILWTSSPLALLPAFPSLSLAFPLRDFSFPRVSSYAPGPPQASALRMLASYIPPSTYLPFEPPSPIQGMDRKLTSVGCDLDGDGVLASKKGQQARRVSNQTPLYARTPL